MGVAAVVTAALGDSVAVTAALEAGVAIMVLVDGAEQADGADGVGVFLGGVDIHGGVRMFGIGPVRIAHTHIQRSGVLVIGDTIFRSIPIMAIRFCHLG